MSNKLKELIINEEELLREILADILKDYVNIRRNGEIVYKNLEGLDAEKKVIIGYLAHLATKLLGLKDTEKVSAKKISEEMAMNYNTVRPIISKLVRARILNREGRGQYYISLSKVRIIKEKYFGEGKKKQVR